MDKKEKDLNYFELRLQELLHASFPERAEDRTFIKQRAGWAANAYEGAFMAGNPIEECDHIANYILFENLHFSRFDAILQVLSSEFADLMLDEELRPFALKMLKVCEPVFENYHLTDDFAYSYEFDALYTELTGAIAIWIEQYGIQ